MAPNDSKRSKLQLLVHLAQNKLAGRCKLTQDQVDTLALALSSVPLSELHLNKAEQFVMPEPHRPSAIGHHMLPATDAAAAEQLHSQRHAPSLNWARPPITYLHIYEDGVLSLGVFCMPALSQIPLHDHPGMTVFTRVLYGQMHYMGYDWVDPSCKGDFDSPEPARLITDRTFTARDDPIVLFPRAGGNLHQLTALSDCAIISLLCPPYNAGQGRDCHYYSIFESRDTELDPDIVLLEKSHPPQEFYIGCGRYCGVVPTGRPRAPSPTTTLDYPLVDSPSGSMLTSCNLAAAAVNADRALLALSRSSSLPMPDTIPLPQRWL